MTDVCNETGFVSPADKYRSVFPLPARVNGLQHERVAVLLKMNALHRHASYERSHSSRASCAILPRSLPFSLRNVRCL